MPVALQEKRPQSIEKPGAKNSAVKSAGEIPIKLVNGEKAKKNNTTTENAALSLSEKLFRLKLELTPTAETEGNLDRHSRGKERMYEDRRRQV
jgi:hypothetical protein